MPTQHYTPLPDLTLHHLAWAGDDPPIVFIPGFIATGIGAMCLATAVPNRVLALDLRGRGRSDKPSTGYGVQQHVVDLKAWLAAQGIERCILAGHSFGGSVALFFTLAYPDLVEKIILLDGGVPPSETAFQLFLAYHQNLKYTYPSVEAYLAPYRQMITLQPWTDAAEQLTRANITEQPDGSAMRTVPPHVVEVELAQLDLAQWQALPRRYPQITVPVLLIRAGLGSFSKDDQHITDAILAQLAALPHLTVYDMPQAGHTGILTVPDVGRDTTLRNFVHKA